MSFSTLSLRRFFVRLFAIVGALTTLSIVLTVWAVIHYGSTPAEPPKPPESMVLDLDFTLPVTEQARGFSVSLQSLMRETETQRLSTLLRALNAAKDDPHVKGVIAHFSTEAPSLAKTQEIRKALEKIRANGKFAYAFGSDFGAFGLGNKTYYLASAFEKLWLQPVGTVGFSTLGVEAPFAKDALEKIGVKATFIQREEYKSAMENVTRTAFSAPAKENLTRLMQGLSDQIADGVAKGRQKDGAQTRSLMAEGPFTAEEAKQKGLVDVIGYEDDMLKDVEAKAGKDYVRVDPMEYLVYRPRTPEPKKGIAFITAQGMIVDTAPRGPAKLAEDEQVAADEIAQAFDDAREDKDVDAILFRVNSPGGSPSASETIRHALVRAREAGKPVFVSMGDLAASGGYWISMSANKIYADPGTLTGSIGVIGGKFIIGDLLQKLGVTFDTIHLGGNSGLWSLRTDFSPAELARVNAMMDETYRVFLTNVEKARNIPAEKMPDLAKGRVFTGEEAQKLGLVDEIGGLTDTIDGLKKELKLADTDLVHLYYFPAPETPASFAFKILKNLGLEIAGMQQTMAPLHALRGVITPALRAGLGSTQPVGATLPPAYDALVK